MKNVSHPNMFPVAGESVAIAPEAPTRTPRPAPIVTDADVGGITAAPAPTNPWANPLSRLQWLESTPAAAPKHATRADEAIAYLRLHGPSPAGDLCKAMGITSKGGITPFINGALKDGRIVRDNGKYSVGIDVAPQPEAEAKAVPEAISHFEAATAIVSGRKKSKPVATPADPGPEPTPARANLPVAASEAAAAIAAMRQPPESKPVDLAPEADAPVVVAPVGRKPEFVVFVGDIQLLSWPDGDITIQTESNTVELSEQHFRALITLVELRKNDF